MRIMLFIFIFSPLFLLNLKTNSEELAKQRNQFINVSELKKAQVRLRKIQTSKYVLAVKDIIIPGGNIARLAPLKNGYAVAFSLQNAENHLLINIDNEKVNTLGRLDFSQIKGGDKFVWPRILDVKTLEIQGEKSGENWLPEKAKILASISVFDGNKDKRCQFVFVQMLNIDLLRKKIDFNGRHLFKSPCIPEKIGRNHSWESGGGLAILPKSMRTNPDKLEFLIGLGHFHIPFQSDYYKNLPYKQKRLISAVVRVNDEKHITVHSRGFRNTQGLSFIHTGLNDIDLIGTDHGPYSGDELNLIKEGFNYGWPYSSFGYRYNKRDRFIPSTGEGLHLKGQRPIYMWPQPGTAASPIIQVRSSLFTEWAYTPKMQLSTILIGAMAKKSLLVLTYDGERILGQENIHLGYRTRSLAFLDGKLLVGSDDGILSVIIPEQIRKGGEFLKINKLEFKTSRASVLKNSLSGKLIFKQCRGCHSLEPGKNQGGPSLFKIVGRKIASIKEWEYSKALKQKKIIWNKENLDKFLLSPKDFIPGSNMVFRGIPSKQDRKQLIEYLYLYK